MKVLRTRLNIALGGFLLQCPTAGKEPLVVVLPSLNRFSLSPRACVLNREPPGLFPLGFRRRKMRCL